MIKIDSRPRVCVISYFIELLRIQTVLSILSQNLRCFSSLDKAHAVTKNDGTQTRNAKLYRRDLMSVAEIKDHDLKLKTTRILEKLANWRFWTSYYDG